MPVTAFDHRVVLMPNQQFYAVEANKGNKNFDMVPLRISGSVFCLLPEPYFIK